MPKADTMKNNVVTCRVNDDMLASLDALVDSGIYPTRSEAAAVLLQVGLGVNQHLLKRARETAAEIQRLREEARAGAHTVASAPRVRVRGQSTTREPLER